MFVCRESVEEHINCLVQADAAAATRTADCGPAAAPAPPNADAGAASAAASAAAADACGPHDPSASSTGHGGAVGAAEEAAREAASQSATNSAPEAAAARGKPTAESEELAVDSSPKCSPIKGGGVRKAATPPRRQTTIWGHVRSRAREDCAGSAKARLFAEGRERGPLAGARRREASAAPRESGNG